jgi:Bacterial PH domain
MNAHRVKLKLPAGETVLWQGRPQWRNLALRAFHVRSVAVYFSVLVLWRSVSLVLGGDGALSIAAGAMWLLLPCGAACGILALLAWLSSRTTQYIITSRRVIMRFGIALPITLNVPFGQIGSAALRLYADGSGEIPLATTGENRVAFLMLWPHVRPWRVTRTEPMLRSVEDAQRVAEILARAAVAAASATETIKPLASVATKPTAAAMSVFAAT